MEESAAPTAHHDKKLWMILSIVFVTVAGLSFVGSYYAISHFVTHKPLQIPLISQTAKQDVTSAGTACPLNGVRYTDPKWQDHRPLGVMIENNVDARPQSGLPEADVVYEAVAEGGITRFMAVFLCDAAPADVTVGPVRSARTFFLDWISEYDGLYTHVGGANTAGPADALGQIIRYGIKDINQFNYDYPTFWRDQNRLAKGYALEHTMYSSTQKLWGLAETKLGWGATDQKTGKNWEDSFTPWYFINDPTPTATGSASKVTIPFWEHTPGPYTVVWNYDLKSKLYKRDNASAAAIDAVTGQQLTTKNIIIQFMEESHANDGYPGNQHLLYGTIGTGEAWIIQDGTITKGIWKKKDRMSRTKYYDATGNEISMIRGKIWIETVPTYAKANVIVK